MIPEFEQLNEDERNTMFSLPIFVSVLIAAADGKVDNAEIKKAISLSSIKTMKARKALLDYYKIINTDYEDKFKMTLANLPSDHKIREDQLILDISKVNDIFPKLDQPFAVKLYASLKDMAKHIAEASGGVFGYMSIGYEESKLVELKMIKNPGK